MAQFIDPRRTTRRRFVDASHRIAAFTSHLSKAGPVVAVRRRPAAEDRLAYAHDVRTFLDRFLEIARHAHGKFTQRPVAPDSLITKAAKKPEARAHLVHIGREQCEGHQTSGLQAGKPVERVDERKQRIGMQPELALLAGRIDLHIDVKHAVLALEPRVEAFGQPQAVQRMELARKTGEMLDLVGLEVTDDGPLDREIGERLLFGGSFLNLVLAEGTNACFEGVAEDMRRHRLGDRQEPDGGAVPPGARAGGGDALLDRRQIGTE